MQKEYTYFVTGTKFRGVEAQVAIRNAKEIRLRAEPENKHDRNAIAVDVRHNTGIIFKKERWTHIGYIRKDAVVNLKDALETGRATVTSASTTTGSDGRLYMDVGITFE